MKNDWKVSNLLVSNKKNFSSTNKPLLVSYWCINITRSVVVTRTVLLKVLIARRNKNIHRPIGFRPRAIIQLIVFLFCYRPVIVCKDRNIPINVP